MAAGGLSRSERKAAERVRRLREEQQRERLRQVSRILRKAAAERSAEEGRLLAESADLVTELQGRSRRREGLKRRQEEVCDDPEELRGKVRELAGAVRNAKYLIVYTGAGISTAASIPDYRGPNGVWTLLQKGRSVSAADLSEAEPTLTHMSITRLHEQKLVQHVVSQNCDGLHLRSGLPRTAISELHGNMYIEGVRAGVRCDRAHRPPQTPDRPDLPQVWDPAAGHHCALWGEGDVGAASELGSSDRGCQQSRHHPVSRVQPEGSKEIPTPLVHDQAP
ncbi:NAD-dependent protein deacetylase sirtuin-7 isoform X3 [Nomascus leucogenys]|uniref:NAD-dependent protein deacetylase sirtuin-7 isoform X3 n=1 Tax=Nomascus leucogenys TaxID=61853 RepID=UPI00122D6522|nr:NAD-dependent protein deacetylase sirtuin-7 isoform X3 [Nomascus leucogenys]